MPYGNLLADVVQSSTAGTPPQFNDGNGTQTGTLSRAWVDFNGSTAAIRASFNVGSVTRTTTGTYTVNLTAAMTDANSATVAIAGGQNRFASAYPSAAGTIAVTTATNGGALTDETYISVVLFR